MKHQAVSEALAEKIAVSVHKQKALTEKYAEKWRKITQEAKFLKGQLHRQTHIRHNPGQNYVDTSSRKAFLHVNHTPTPPKEC